MTVLDRELEQLAALINDLPRQSQAAVFWAASTAHLESASGWAEEHGEMFTVLREAQEAAFTFCVGGLPVDRASALLDELGRSLPENVVVQSSWICADAALRIVVDATFEPGMSIEYALEPAVGRASEALFGYWQVGGGDDEDEEVVAIMAQPDVVKAVEFCRWAVQRLATTGALSDAVLEDIGARAAVLTNR